MSMTARLYSLDYNAGAPPDPRVVAAMAALPPEADANPHSPHRLGRQAAQILEAARERIAACLGVEPSEVVLTSGGTESNNQAVHAMFAEAARTGGTFCWSPLEHASTAGPAQTRAATGQAAARCLAVSPQGEILPPEGGLPGPALVAVNWAHHELGVVQDLAPFGVLTRATRGWLHVDASQALGRLPLAEAVAAADTITLSPHKAGGPRGVGILVVRAGRALVPLLQGGMQELGRRPGTQWPRAVHGAALAIEIAGRETASRAAAMQAALDTLLAALDGAAVRVLCDRARRLLPNTRTLSWAPLRADHLLAALDLAGVVVSYGAACTSGAMQPSVAMRAIGVDEGEARGCLRVSVGPELGASAASEAGALFSQVVRRCASLAGKNAFDSSASRAMVRASSATSAREEDRRGSEGTRASSSLPRA